jgi:hypothetical protein
MATDRMRFLLNAAHPMREAMQTISEVTHSRSSYLRGGLPDRRPSSTVRHSLAHVARSSRLARAAVVAQAGVLHSPARVGRLASRLGGLARCAVPLCGRFSVHAAHVGVGRWSRRAVAVVAARAVLPGVDQVGC